MSRSIQWLNENSYRAYPFIEDSDMTATGGLTLSPSVVLDFSLVNYASNAQPVRLRSLEITAAPVPEGIFTFAYDAGPTFSFAVPASASLPFTAVISSAGMHTTIGVFGAGIATLLTAAVGIYYFNTPPIVEPVLTVFQAARRLNTLVGTGLGSVTIAGAIKLVEGYNCAVTLNTSTNTAVIAARAGAGAGRYCLPLDTTEPTCSDVLLSINGMHADDNGNFELRGGPGVTIIPGSNEIIVRGAKSSTDAECG